MALFIVSSLLGGINYITTVINLRTRGMSFTKMPLTIWAFFFTAIIGVLSFPVLVRSSVAADLRPQLRYQLLPV